MESLAGIKPGSPGFQTLEIEPCFTDKLDYVKASYESVQGFVSSHWNLLHKGTDSGSNVWKMELETPVPAKVILPDGIHEVEKGTHTFEISS